MQKKSWELELCWGTVRGASLPELAAIAGAAGYAAMTVTPAMYYAARAAGFTDASLRELLREHQVRVSIVDPLISALPGVPSTANVAADLRSFFEYGTVASLDAAQALGATTLNLAHFLGADLPAAELAAAIVPIAAQAQERNLQLTLEFIPGTGIPDLARALEIVLAVGAPNVGVMFDTWHFARSGGHPDQLRDLPADAISGLQLSDRIAPPPGEAYVPMSGRLLPGEGELPLQAILQALLTANSRLAIGVEVFSEELRVLGALAAAKRVADATRKLLASVD